MAAVLVLSAMAILYSGLPKMDASADALQPRDSQAYTALAAIPGSHHLKAQAKGRNPFGRLTKPRDVANMIYLLSLDDASWVNGEVIRVDGGEHVSGATS